MNDFTITVLDAIGEPFSFQEEYKNSAASFDEALEIALALARKNRLNYPPITAQAHVQLVHMSPVGVDDDGNQIKIQRTVNFVFQPVVEIHIVENKKS